MPRTKGGKNRVTASTDFDAQIAKLQKDKATLEEGLSKTVAQIEELKTDMSTAGRFSTGLGTMRTIELVTFGAGTKAPGGTSKSLCMT